MEFAKFEIIGRVAKIEHVGKAIFVNIAANYSKKNDADEWVDDTYWNRVSIFFDRAKKTAERANKGDLVRVAGRVKDSSYVKDGATHYTTDRNVEEFSILRSATAANPQDDK